MAMPPIRTSPAKHRFAAAPFIEEDDGFNPQWALSPEDPIFKSTFSPARPLYLQEPEPVTRPVPPTPQTRITHLPPEIRNYNKEVGFDNLTLSLLLPLAFVYNTASKLGSLAYEGVSAMVRVGGVVKKRILPGRQDPVGGRRRRQQTPVKKRAPKDSMLNLPPHMVGATPNVVRQARGERPRRDPTTHTPTADEARKWQLFHATPLHKKPKPKDTPLPTAPGTPWATPKFEVNTSQRKIKAVKSKQFAMNVHKGEFKEWLRLLKKHGLGTTALRRVLTENLAFPTDLILSLHDKKARSGDGGFDTLVKCFSHEGFTTFYKILIPNIKYPSPRKFQEGECENIDLNSVHQQEDGCCKFCRGFSWAGKVEEREVEKGGEVPCKSQHKSTIPYTKEEQREFDRFKYDALFRRWCKESRYDWVFETPQPSGWEIPQDDPRLRHISMLRQQHKATYGAPKMYDADLMASRTQLRTEISRQDLAAKILIDAIRKENPTLAAAYEKMDLERKRRQVRTDWLCVKQVKIRRKEPPKEQAAFTTVASPAVPKPAPRPVVGKVPKTVLKRAAAPAEQEEFKPVKRVKFASEPEGPTVNPRKTPAKGILKTTSSVVSRQKSARLAAKNRKNGTNTNLPADQFLFNLPSQTNGRQPVPATSDAASPPPVPHQKPNPRLNFSTVPSLAPTSKNEPTYFFGASSGVYNRGIPSSFDPVAIRQQYNAGVLNASTYWEDLNTNPYGWKPDPNLTKEENDAERYNYNIQKRMEQQEREKEMRALELAEEQLRGGRQRSSPTNLFDNGTTWREKK
ncbi:hypothetical protein FN846DRAFT_921244 [Sphaerosporella brunnea]|uniref:Uncharacterized protein n=1 Tax=Sphaerosporella brunnea TaxID=1250544 RepID=A0A5J5EN17_9PEZI|nr:hypothetical protein FN846DRAFT_921244 [Sphaerosporella brunnea]